MDPYTVLGVQPGASKADIKKAFFQKAKQHHPDMHTTASASVQKAHDAAFRALNEAYQALMEGTYRPRQRTAAGRGGFGRGGAFYGAAGGAQHGTYHDPFASSYGENVGRGYWGYRNFGRRAGLDFRAAFRAFTSISRAEVAATAALGLLLAGGLMALEGTSQSLWSRHNRGKLFDSIEREVEQRKRQKEQAAAEAAAASAALRAATAAMRQREAAAVAAEVAEATAAARQQEAAVARSAALATVLPAGEGRTTSRSDVVDASGSRTSGSGLSGSCSTAASAAQGAAREAAHGLPSGMHGPAAATAQAAGSSGGGLCRAVAAEASAPQLAPGAAQLEAATDAHAS